MCPVEEGYIFCLLVTLEPSYETLEFNANLYASMVIRLRWIIHKCLLNPFIISPNLAFVFMPMNADVEIVEVINRCATRSSLRDE